MNARFKALLSPINPIPVEPEDPIIDECLVVDELARLAWRLPEKVLQKILEDSARKMLTSIELIADRNRRGILMNEP